MLSKCETLTNAPAGSSTAGDGPPDYAQIRRAISFLSENWRTQPDLAQLCRHLDMSASHCQRLFKRWCGLSPKEFVQAITIDHARAMLENSASLLDATYDLGLSGPARLHDLFVDHEAMTPGDFKRRGNGLTIRYGFHPCPFGDALVMATDRGVCGLAFADGDGEREAALADMTARWPAAGFVADDEMTGVHCRQIFSPETWRRDRPVRLVLIGTDFEVRVWETLLKIPAGRAVSYSDLATHVGHPKASRAVGSAVGRNPISFVVPCHRVLRKDGGLGGYHWGVTRKRAMIGWELGRMA